MDWMTLLPLFTKVGAQGVQTAMNLRAQGMADDADDQVAAYDIAALERRAGQERASAQRRAEMEREKARKLMGIQRAKAAASGAGLDGSFEEIIADTAIQGKYNSDVRLWEGEQASDDLLQRASMRRYAQRVAQAGRGAKRAATILEGVSEISATVAGADFGKKNRSLYYGDDDTSYDPLWRDTTVRYG